MSGLELLAYFGFVAIAIGGLWLLLNALGQGREASFTEDEARAVFLERFPETPPGEARVLKHAVLFDLGPSGVGLVRAQGHFPVIRIMTSEDIAAILPRERVVSVRLRDFADPAVRLVTETPQDVAEWLKSRLLPKNDGNR